MSYILTWTIFLYFFSFAILEIHAIESGSIVPLYVYPTDGTGLTTWRKLYQAYEEQPINTWAIVNVNSGPGYSLDPNYVTAINNLHSAGIHTLGYVSTDYTWRSKSDVQSDIDRWRQFYGTHGIFFDEMSSEDVTSKVQYYQDVHNHARSKGFTFTVGNAGTLVSPRYFNTVDNIVVFEKSTGFPNSDEICSQETNGKGRNAVTILAYNINSPDYNRVTRVKNCAGFVYVTDDSGANPWDTLPDYLTQLFLVLKWWTES